MRSRPSDEHGVHQELMRQAAIKIDNLTGEMDATEELLRIAEKDQKARTVSAIFLAGAFRRIKAARRVAFRERVPFP